MTKNPLLNALAAFGYIVLIVLIMNFLVGRFKNTPDTMFTPILPLSLFTLSAAVMGYIFGAQPLTLFLDGKKKEGINLFVQTMGIFAAFTLLVLVAVASGLLS